ncbi:hypothetical protein QTP93_04645 [Staphylococcus borealis]|uniref:hypothetical protein n=1 Tax=Staphylococcus borealis TaxID=2742203 RepID=UPI0025A02348|nr:hypothetical protein [Staphylococcus borealis]MDM7863231.1 hypothetical protein [Staphylococcus borealis]
MPGEKSTELLSNSKPSSITMLHNHSGQSGFSLHDLAMFIKFDSIKNMTIVTNSGQIKYLSKSNGYSKKIFKIFKETILNIEEVKLEKRDIDIFLKKYII